VSGNDEDTGTHEGYQFEFVAKDMNWFVCADRPRLKQILINLLSNAIKYKREGETVIVACTRYPQGRIRVSIRDMGIGFRKARTAVSPAIALVKNWVAKKVRVSV
jgi:signal transduction histidine kinase